MRGILIYSMTFLGLVFLLIGLPVGLLFGAWEPLVACVILAVMVWIGCFAAAVLERSES